MPNYQYDLKPVDKNGTEHRSVYPGSYTNLTQYLEELMGSATRTKNSLFLRDYLTNILAARSSFNVEPNKKSALDAARLRNADNLDEAAKRVQDTQNKLFENGALQEYLKGKTDDQLRELVSSGGHGGKLERDFAKHVCTRKGPMLADTPRRYMPTALTRIEVLQKQLKALRRNAPNYKERAASICMEIVATRAAVNCTPGDKSTLKHKYDPAEMNRYYNGLMRTAGQDLSDDALNKLVRGALKGHGGTMEKVVQDLVREDMQRNHRAPDEEVPTRYQVTYGERLASLREEISSCLDVIKMGRELKWREKEQLREALAEVAHLNSLAKIQSQREDGAPADGLRIEQKKARLGTAIRTTAASKGFDVLLGRIERGEDVVDELDAALKNGMNSEKVRQVVQKEINNAALEKVSPEAWQQQLKEQQDRRKQQRDYDDQQVEGVKGSKLRDEMNRKLGEESIEITSYDRDLKNPDSLRILRVICDKRMAMLYAYNKSVDPRTKQVDEQKFARELSGERFRQNLQEVREDPTYQKMMRDMARQEDFGVTLKLTAMYPDTILFNRYQRELTAPIFDAEKYLASLDPGPKNPKVDLWVKAITDTYKPVPTINEKTLNDRAPGYTMEQFRQLKQYDVSKLPVGGKPIGDDEFTALTAFAMNDEETGGLYVHDVLNKDNGYCRIEKGYKPHKVLAQPNAFTTAFTDLGSQGGYGIRNIGSMFREVSQPSRERVYDALQQYRQNNKQALGKLIGQGVDEILQCNFSASAGKHDIRVTNEKMTLFHFAVSAVKLAQRDPELRRIAEENGMTKENLDRIAGIQRFDSLSRIAKEAKKKLTSGENLSTEEKKACVTAILRCHAVGEQQMAEASEKTRELNNKYPLQEIVDMDEKIMMEKDPEKKKTLMIEREYRSQYISGHAQAVGTPPTLQALGRDGMKLADRLVEKADLDMDKLLAIKDPKKLLETIESRELYIQKPGQPDKFPELRENSLPRPAPRPVALAM